MINKHPISSRLAILIIYVVLVLIRVPRIIWPGRFWAEEGAVYFREAYLHAPWDVISSADLGYYSLLNKVASIAAAHAVPLQYAPVITMLFALSVQIVPAWLLLYSDVPSMTSSFHRACAVFLVLLVQPNQEIWLNTINSQFFLCISTAIILISAPANRYMHWLRLGMLAVAGLTGVVSCLLLPFFWIEYAWTRNRHKLSEVAVLTCVCAIQGAVVMAGTERNLHWYLNLLPSVLLTKQLLLPVFGAGIADSFSTYVKLHRLFNSVLFSIAVLLPYIALGFGLVRWGNRHSWLLLASSVSVAAISFLGSIEAANPDLVLVHLSAVGADRYYYAPNVLLALALLLPLRQYEYQRQKYSRGFRAACMVLAGSMFIVGAFDFFARRQIFDGPSWPAEVKIWRDNKSDLLRIWPRPWSMELLHDVGQRIEDGSK